MEKNNNNKTNKQKEKAGRVDFANTNVSAASRRTTTASGAAPSEAIVCRRVSPSAEEQIKYIILSFSPFSRSSGDSEGGRKRDEERRAYWKVFVAADGALASNCIYRLRRQQIASR